MKVHIRLIMLLAMAALLLAGCAAAPVQAPTETTPPMSVVAEPGEYDVKIYTIDPDAVDIPDASVPLAPSAEPTLTPEGPLTKRQAEALAIQHAGLSQNDVSFLFSKEDTEDGIPVFEVSFRSGNFSYEFEIATESGEILTYEKEDIRKD